ncbi:DNA-binding protein [Thermococcus litoralis DSM 5473]|jgi:predicted nucleic acid-binding protein|uniref:DNA-binding protein n=1 Tax=Thermococcus litoralis (strain ATCC 51850 / DSM 5473 / JCM 8560 / NS-C) TaxID=523849 RepID=H3ZP04_THELN|nr:PIN domain-containing protein [Thermococcus litoralis]EHR78345.1 DNA-binding protein [Thermococcus litoralis DSM 5473]
MFLVDTNVFLEILLGQKKKEEAKKFLSENIDRLYMTDFSLHSIGVILFKLRKPEVFEEFIEDVLPNVEILSLPVESYPELIRIHKTFNLNFDDAYQCAVANVFDLTVVTMDTDFTKALNYVKILFL